MTLTTSDLTGRVVLPGDQAFTDGVLTFTLSDPDTELEQVIPHAGYEIVLSGDDLPTGAKIWRNTEGDRGTSYSVKFTATMTKEVGGGQTIAVRKTFDLGSIQVGDADTYSIGELLRTPVGDAADWQRQVRFFATFSGFVDWAESNTPPIGAVVEVDGKSYRYTGTGTAIDGLPGWVIIQSDGVAYASLVDAAAATIGDNVLTLTVLDGGVATRYIRDLDGTLTTADGAKWGAAETSSGGVTSNILAAISETEAADAINWEPRRISITSGAAPYVVDARDSFPHVHMILLSAGVTAQIDVSTLDLYKPYYFANISQVRDAPATLDCGIARNFAGALTDPVTSNKRTFDLQPGMSCTLRRIGGSIINVEFEHSHWIGTADYRVRMQPDGTYDVRIRYNTTGSTPIGAGAAATVSTSTYLDLSNAVVEFCTVGARTDNAAMTAAAPFVEKMGAAGGSGLLAHQLSIRNPDATSITGPITTYISNIARV